MAENIIGKDLISLFRGQPMFGQTTNQALSSYPRDKMLSGRFFTTNPDIAKSYAKYSAFPSVVKEMKVPSNVLNQAYNFKDRLTNFPTKTFSDLPQRKDVLIVSKDMLKNYRPSINLPATVSSNLYQGLGFLRNNALKTLATLASLPFQAGLMTLAPTKMGNAELSQGGGDGRYGRGSDGQQSYDSGQGFGINATTGGPVSNRSGRGRTDYGIGGLV